MSTISTGTTSTTGYVVTSDSTGALVVKTGSGNTTAVTIDANQYPSATINGLGKGAIPAEQFYSLNTALVGANVSTAQSIFGVGVTLVGSTIYQFEAVYALTRASGTSASHSIGIGFGGTATLNNIAYQLAGQYNGTGFTATTSLIANTLPWFIQTASNTVLITGIATTPNYFMLLLKGTISVNAGGTFIPQYTCSVAPTTAYTTAIGSYFKISPLAASGSNVNIGSWA